MLGATVDNYGACHEVLRCRSPGGNHLKSREFKCEEGEPINTPVWELEQILVSQAWEEKGRENLEECKYKEGGKTLGRRDDLCLKTT